MWYKTIIILILKKDEDYREPMSYRGIKIIQLHIERSDVNFLDTHGLLCEEPYGLG